MLKKIEISIPNEVEAILSTTTTMSSMNEMSEINNKIMSLLPIIPVQILFQSDNYTRLKLINGIRYAFITGQIIDNNNPTQSEDIKRQVLQYSDSQFLITNIQRSNKGCKDLPTKILESTKTYKPMKFGSSFGINAAGTELRIFVFREDYPNIKSGTVFLDARVPNVEPTQNNIKQLDEEYQVYFPFAEDFA